MTTIFGGSLQATLVRFTLLDDTEHHRAGSELYSEDVLRVTYARRRDATFGMRLAFVRPHPIPFRFVFGGSLRYDASGELVGWDDPGPVLRPVRYGIEAWSANIHQGAIIGYYRWHAPECVPVTFIGGALEGMNPTAFRASATVDLRRGFGIDAVPQLPDYPRPEKDTGHVLVQAAAA